MKKILAMILMFCTVLTLLGGCGAKETSSVSQQEEEVAQDKKVNLDIPSTNGETASAADKNEDKNATGSKTNDIASSLPNLTITEPDASINLANHDFGGVEIKRIVWYTVGQEEKKMLSEFSSKYNVKVKDIKVDYENINTKLAASMASGDVIDVGFLYGAFFPTQVIANMYMPVDSYIKKDYLVNSASADSIKKGGFDMQKMDFFKWKGHYYGLCSYWDVDMMVMYYNKRKFKEANIKTPLEHVAAGTWNLDTFYDMAFELTDKKAGTYGWSAGGENAGGGRNTFISSYGTQFVKYDSNGTPKQNLGDPRILQALQFIQKMYNGATQVVGNESATFYNGKAAMCTDGLYMIPKLMTNSKVPESVKMNWEIAPIPMAKGHEKDPYPADWLKSVGILRGSKHPDAVAAYAYYRSKYVMDNQYEDFMTNEQKQRVIPFYKNLNYANYAYGDLTIKSGQLIGSVITGSDVAKVISENKSVFQAQIDRVIKG